MKHTSAVCHDEWGTWVQEEKRLTAEEEEDEEKNEKEEEDEEEYEDCKEKEGGTKNMKKHNERLPE